MKISEKNVIAGVTVTIQGNQLLFDNEVAATWSDDFTANCKVEMTFTPQGSSEARAIASSDKLSEAGTLKLTVADEFDNKAAAEFALTRVDSQAPTIEVKIAEKNVIAGVTVTIQGNQLLFDNEVAANWTDDFTANCKVELTFTPQGSSEVRAVVSGDKLSQEGTLKLTVADDFDNKSTAEIALTRVDSQAPTIEVKIASINAIAGITVSVKDNQLLFDNKLAASWADNYSQNCKVTLSFTPKGGSSQTVNSGDNLSQEGTLKLTVADDFDNKSTAEIALTRVDSQAPTIEVKINSINAIAGITVAVKGNQLLFDDKIAATWTDDYSQNCKVTLSFTPKGSSSTIINSGDKLSQEGTLKLTVADDFDNKSTAEIALTRVDSQAPMIEVKIASINAIAGITVSIKDNQLLFDDKVAASWTDDYSQNCKVTLNFTPKGGSSKAVNSGDKLSQEGTLKLTVADDFDNKSTAEIALTKVDSQAPTIEVKIASINAIAGITVTVKGKQLMFDDKLAAIWTDDYTENCKVTLSFTPKGGSSRTVNS